MHMLVRTAQWGGGSAVGMKPWDHPQVFQSHFVAAVAPAWSHSPTSSPGSRLCQDSSLGGCSFQHPHWVCTANGRCQWHLPRFSFSLGCGTWRCQCLWKQSLPFLCHGADYQKKGSRVRIYQKNLIWRGRKTLLFEQLNHRHPRPLCGAGRRKRALQEVESGSFLHPALGSK